MSIWISARTRSGAARWLAAATLLASLVALSYTHRPVDAATTYGRSLSSYLHDVSEPIPGVTVFNSIVEQYRPRMSDGVEIDVWIVRPNILGRLPLVLDVTPYYGGGSPVTGQTALTDGVFHELGTEGNVLVTRGYAYGIVSVRGTGNSGGCFSIGGPQEAKDTAAVIEYLASQPWSNARVGLIGASYDGTTAQDVWVEATPSLKTIVPISGISDLYKYNFVNGVHINPQGYAFNAYYWLLVGLSPAGLYYPSNQLRDPVYVPGAVIGEVCPEQVWVQEGGASSAVNGDKDGYWQQRDFLAELQASPGKKRASVWYIHGLQDWNVKPHNMEDWLAAVQKSGVPFKAMLGQWAHAYPNRPDWWGTSTTPSAIVAWFDQFLKDRNTGILTAPKVQVQGDDGKWRHEGVWPPTAVSKLTYYPHADETLSATPGAGIVQYNDYSGVQSENNTVEIPNDRVVFRSAPLAKDLYISGMPRFEGTVTATGHRASLILSLVEELPDGTRTGTNWAAQSLNHVQSLATGLSSIANIPQFVGVDFFPQDDVIETGNRLLLIASGSVMTFHGVKSGTDLDLPEPYPSLQPLADGSIITIDLQGARLILPVDTSLVLER